MADWFESFDKIIDRFYTYLMPRDITYAISGAMILSVILFANDQIKSLLSLPWWAIILLLSICYFIGLGTQEGFLTLRIFRMYPDPKKSLEQETNDLITLGEMRQKGGEDVLSGLNRLILIKTIFSATGSATIVTLILIVSYQFLGIIALPPSLFISIISLLLLYSVVAILRNKYFACAQASIITRWCSLQQMRDHQTDNAVDKDGSHKTINKDNVLSNSYKDNSVGIEKELQQHGID